MSDPESGRTATWGSDGDAPAIHDARRAALDELARGAPRPGRPAAALGVGRFGSRLADAVPPGSTRRRALIGAALVALVVLAVPGWRLVRRPAAAEDTLPRVTGTTVVSPSDAVDSADGPPASTGTTTGRASGAATPSAPSQFVVHVVGAVVRPGIVRLPSGTRVVDAVDAAGGLAPGADVDRVNLAAPLTDGQRVVIPVVGQAPPVEVAPAPAPVTGAVSGGGPPGPGAPVDLNTATAEQLDTLPGVGPATAAAIIAHRSESGPFTSIDELLDVRGIGPARLDSLRDLVTVGP